MTTPEPNGIPKSTADEPWPVRVVSQKISGWIAKLGWVWVDGQVAQISRRPGASTVFLTLRDPSADLSLTVTTNRDVLDLGAPNLEEGARVTLHAKPDFFPARGTLSLRADEIRQVGLGELLARLERLKKLLAAEGLFDHRRKRRPPFLPRRIGLITGRASAAERDVLTNARRRWPAVEFRVVNVAVQGPTAVPQIVDALKVLDADETIDVIVIARGGGGVEDLLPFSDETLCRAVFACRTPVVSAIGHETDAPLLDYVADVRASTPTDAAKRIVPDLGEEVRVIQTARQRLDRAVLGMIDREQHRLDAIRSRPVLARPGVMIEARAVDVTALRDRAARSLDHRIRAAGDELRHTVARLRALSPAATLDRGYAIVQGRSGHVVRSATEVTKGDVLRVRLAAGELSTTVDEATIEENR
ncbi:exodeoxyribonuclease VII large subunit [Asanoa siamensis]|uniref:Exodeoxyribonuclease 7 large subunit n=1 Tax=Asanoa siamensis TaxID=926357 RepID=A0ABQ4CRU7_9ACTN|nr:exodeoxyribonuclease VII large subunit [Asanoa siamensis]GIF73718.1 exodeoxyribonuclease 7 large subunit [Asanoa siamensis]